MKLNSPKPIILQHMTEDFISNDLFNKIIKHNLNKEGIECEKIPACQQLTPELCKVPKQFFDKIDTKGLDNIVVSTLIQNRNSINGKTAIYKGINYGRLDEGYAGPFVYLQFQQPVNCFSIAYVKDFAKGTRSDLKGNSEDALYFFEEGVINIDDEEYTVQPNTFVFLKNNGLYSITSLSKGEPNYVRKNPYPKDGISPTGVLLVRHGDHELINKNGIEENKYDVNRNTSLNFNDKRLTSQWAIMYFDKNCIAKSHKHTQKEEVFYFFSDIAMNNNIINIANPAYKRAKGFVCVEPGHVHSLNSIYDEVWFHSTNMPAKLNDSERLVK